MGTELTPFRQQLEQQAAVYAEQEHLVGGTFLSIRGGELSFGEEAMPGNQVCVIILDAIRENTYYASKFDADVAASPTCYAFGRGDGADMAPHESMMTAPDYFKPQAEECSKCVHAEWGSADQGRGKACQNRRRLALIPAGFYAPKRGSRDFDLELFDDPKHFQSADVAYIKLPVLSVKEWSKYVVQISTSLRLPPHGVVTRLFVEPDAKAQYKVGFEMIEEVPDALLPIIMERHAQASTAIMQGYAPPQEREAPKPGSLRGLRRR